MAMLARAARLAPCTGRVDRNDLHPAGGADLYGTGAWYGGGRGAQPINASAAAAAATSAASARTWFHRSHSRKNCGQ